jgi:hypothetical protein
MTNKTQHLEATDCLFNPRREKKKTWWLLGAIIVNDEK